MPRIQQNNKSFIFLGGIIQRFPLKETKQIQHSNQMNKDIWTLASPVKQGQNYPNYYLFKQKKTKN